MAKRPSFGCETIAALLLFLAKRKAKYFSQKGWTDAQITPERMAGRQGGRNLGDYSDALIELDDGIGRIMDAVRRLLQSLGVTV
jgi:arylsulfatase A-like enzyme